MADRHGSPRPAPPIRFQRWSQITLGAPVLLVLAFIYVPIAVIAVLSFQGPQGGATFPLRDLGTIWYKSLTDLTVITEH
ncbi:MAG: hypothetical protein QF637_12010, partial [Acidimicrobiales bacterium]|nr:hypothetical protein [Acidimicrobiales bacterium]